MTNEDKALLEDLKGKPTRELKPAEKAKLKSLERLAKKEQQAEAPKPKRNNTFGVTPTTKLASVPFRISGEEKSIMTDTAKRITGTELFYDRLGGKDDLSNNTQMRAALRAYEKLSDEEKVEAIREAKLSMARAQR
ncbi:hypothetical protein BCS71_25305 (plasmid) [Vibrio lentus]|uniref:hypothetical protein n=1 Tax=Vibrio lentus TaxID=136468 RepID=UPI000C8633C3|nr:hypothetical protein [Vibrio lentus]PMI60695.1 hypothetical protein BCU41_02115 [Vibrio lentus]PMK93245.1 hypothetical protein BCT90_04410 [Vibrio lentus]